MPVKFRDTININDSYTFPSADGTVSQAMITDGAGTLSFSAVSDGQTVKIECKNTSGSTITKGTPVYVTGTVGTSFRVQVAPADGSDSAKMPAVGVLETDLANNGEGYAVTGGLLKNLTTDPIDSTNTASNDTIYVKSGGGLTMTKPTGTNLIQNIGKVARVNSSNAGSIIVSSILRTNDLPNIPQNNIWLGNASSVPTATSHTVGNISDVTLSSLSDGQALVWDNTSSYWKNSTISAGSTSLNVEKNILTGDGSTTAFTVSSSIVSENNTQVYIDGVYQSKDNYSTSGSTVTFSTAPANGAEIEIIHFVSVQGAIKLDSFTGDNSTVTFATGASIIDENNTQVYIDGVYQSKDNYTTSSSNITFSTAPGTGSIIEVVHIKAIDLSTIVADQLAGDGSTVAFTLSRSIDDENNTFVFINGVYQDKSTYSLSGTTLTFSTAPQNGYTIEVMSFDSISIASTGVTTVNDLSGVLTIAAGNGISISKNTGTKTLTIANTLVDTTVSYNTPTGQSLTYTTPSQSTGQAGSVYGPQTFTITGGSNIILSGAASISGLPNGVTLDSQSYNNTNASNVLTITLGGVFPSTNSLNTNLTISGLTATSLVPADYLVVAGGGSGSSQQFNSGGGGGGGAGGLRTSYGSTSGGGSSAESSLLMFLSTNYTVTIGAGGVAPATGNVNGTSGNDSVFSTITSDGGGAGGFGGTGGQGALGGSGGGGTTGGSATANQGFAGGDYVAPTGGGGGGAGAAGSDGAGGNPGAGGPGGDGIQVDITGASVYYAGGGGGGAYQQTTTVPGGNGGGGNSSGDGGAPTAGTANTGGGGGTSGGSFGSGFVQGASGGSGVVILRYPNTYTITVGAGLTSSTATDGSDKVTTFTAGTDSISFS